MVSKAMMCSLLVLLGSATTSWATPVLMQQLPVSSKFACLICHDTAEPVSADLNAFGTAFEQNDKRWDSQLAAQSSDTDGCTNGFELGDENGDGQLDEGLSTERYNPGNDDCELQIREAAWGALKKLFQ